MLERLNIRNFALIDDIEVEFAPGFNVFTGETGAGKSIVVGALKLALGHRASSDTVRRGTDKARIEALFHDVRQFDPVLDDMGMDTGDGELILSRVIQKNRSRCYVNGQLCPAKSLLKIGSDLVDFHGQHEHQSLMDPSRQLLLLDAFGGLGDRRSRVAELYGQWRAVRTELHSMQTDERERLRHIDILRHEAEEIRTADLRPGEEDELIERRRIVANAEKLFMLAEEGLAVLQGESNSVALADMWSDLESRIGQLADIDDQFADVRAVLTSTRAELDELGYRLQRYSSDVQFDPDELENIDERLSVVRQLKRKYGDTVADVMEYGEQCTRQLASLDSHDERVAELQEKCSALYGKAVREAGKLSSERAEKAKKLAVQTLKELRPLAMDKARLEVVVNRKADEELGPTGLDDVDIMFSANPGENISPLRSVASGGELSRVMLALKVVLAKSDQSSALVFDEIDAGVGRTVAGRIAEKLKSVSRHHQVLCITHLPQIAAAADNHIHIEKVQTGDRTVTRASIVRQEDRVSEIAKLLGGTDESDLSVKHAREMLEKAGQDGR